MPQSKIPLNIDTLSDSDTCDPETRLSSSMHITALARYRANEHPPLEQDTAVTTFGSLDILVNNAGIMDKMTAVADVTDELWERVFAVNVTGPMWAIRKALPIMIQQGRGVIVNTASVGGLFGSRAGAAYTASTHAIVGLTRNVGFQYAQLGTRCNAIAPAVLKPTSAVTCKTSTCHPSACSVPWLA
ncbi:hypothetical protein N007_18670 [Alicyclobacillus acidoterrestris ATCC 49025]|nr:hypothetical protein N007_18670 [Alicyclobacillus acidoterrestris ATCC 49025]